MTSFEVNKTLFVKMKIKYMFVTSVGTKHFPLQYSYFSYLCHHCIIIDKICRNNKQIVYSFSVRVKFFMVYNQFC